MFIKRALSYSINTVANNSKFQSHCCHGGLYVKQFIFEVRFPGFCVPILIRLFNFSYYLNLVFFTISHLQQHIESKGIAQKSVLSLRWKYSFWGILNSKTVKNVCTFTYVMYCMFLCLFVRKVNHIIAYTPQYTSYSAQTTELMLTKFTRNVYCKSL